MAAQEPPVANADAQNAEGGITFSGLIRPLLMAYMFHMIMKGMTSGNNNNTHAVVQQSAESASQSIADSTLLQQQQIVQSNGIFEVADEYKSPEMLQKKQVNPLRVSHSNIHRNTFPDKCQMYLQVFLSTSSLSNVSTDALIWEEKNLRYTLAQDDDDAFERHTDINVTLPDSVKHSNGSLYAHVYLTREGYLPFSHQEDRYEPLATVHRVIQLNVFAPPPKKSKKRRNLLDTTTTTVEEDSSDDTEWISYWRPSFRVNPVHDFTIYKDRNAPPPLFPHFQVDQRTGSYLPMLYLNDFWVYREDWIELNATTVASPLPLSITYYPIGLMKFMMYTQFQIGMSSQQASGMQSPGDSDEMKRMFTDTNPYLLALTFFVTLLHTVFDFLAFKNDVAFWKKKKSMAGLSLRTILLNCFFQSVIFLYLVENDTSWTILISSGIGLAIEFWKISKAVVVSKEGGKWSIKGVESYEESPTAKYDKIAVRHLCYVMYPLMAGYAIYTLIYNEHRGWYSWVLSTLTSFVYAFGFIWMFPQLYINYRLKSVAHMPWRAMVYKSLNTFIDDLFAFIIKMPMLHRLSCFRDDLIFFIYLYQKWAYPVDKSRVNEYGMVSQESKDDGTKED